MKKNLFWLLNISLLLFACNNSKKQNGYTITGILKGIDSGMVKISTSNEADRTSKVIDSAIIKNSQFELKGKIDNPQMVNVSITPGNWSFNIFLEDTILQVTADTIGSQHYDYTSYGGSVGAILKTYTESGSRNYDDWMQYQNDPGQHQYDTIITNLYKKAEAEAKKNNLDQEYVYRDQADSVRSLLQKWQKSKIESYVDQHPASVAGVYMFNQLYIFSQDMSVEALKNMLNKYTDQAKTSVYYKYLSNELAKKEAVAVGSVAPDFTLMRRDSSKFTLSSTRGKYMMIDFWASWCHPCRQAIPHWKEVYQKYHDKGFDMVSVSDDSRWSDWERAMDQEKMPWTQVCDEFPVKNMPARVGSLYMTTYIPFYVLLDKEGKILVYSGKEADIDNKLKEIFGS
ncbi:MAG TPA: TlpA disulfide reductase family protein [Arachidicoccus soli]|uniref:AhpC/TSA family protein n=1 Tax=Arachidicoccus soli TaxID=2341117 RepID=A0A386HP47_9BACT|nr:TlpA disulfide reductase family protein [Arachidicoccus soli]AYD47462.1 AhpC/TSA family protein [Arachidicoccus soli]HEU0228696.1 TlpA disulfide reductase family protein [Arachidicoccus soli]